MAGEGRVEEFHVMLVDFESGEDEDLFDEHGAEVSFDELGGDLVEQFGGFGVLVGFAVEFNGFEFLFLLEEHVRVLADE